MPAHALPVVRDLAHRLPRLPSESIEDFLDCAGLPVGMDLPAEGELLEILSSLDPLVLREMRRQWGRP